MEQEQPRNRILSMVSDAPSVNQMSSSRSAAIRLLRQLTQAQRSKKLEVLQSKIKTLSEINDHIEQAINKNEPDMQVFGEEKLIIYIRYCFIENIYKTQPIRYLRLVMFNESIVRKYLTQNIPLYLSRVVERDDTNKTSKAPSGFGTDQQILEVLKLMNVWISKFGRLFPKYLAGTLIAYAQLPIIGDDKRKQTKIPATYKIFAIDIVLSLAINNTRLCCLSGGFGLLINCVLDPLFSDKSSQILYKLLYFYNQNSNRNMVLQYMELGKIFHVFTDIDNTFAEETIKSKGGFDGINRYQQQLLQAKSAIMSILKSWTGLIYIGSQSSILKSFLEAIKQIPKKQNYETRTVMFSILQQILNIGDNYLADMQKKQDQNELKVSNLVSCYLVTLLELLIENNLFRTLIELSSVDEYSLAEPAQKLLKKLTILIFNFFPDSSKFVDFLITAATTTHPESHILKSASSFVINKIGNYIYDPKQTPFIKLLSQFETIFSLNTMHKNFQLSSTDSVMQTLNFITHRELEGSYRKSLLDKNMVSKENKDTPAKWKWDMIEGFLRYPSVQKITGYKVESNEKYKQGKLFQYLLRYYTPSKGLFLNEKWASQNFQYIKTGQLMIQNTIVVPDFISLLINPGFSQFEIMINFVGELQKLLKKVLESLAQNPKQFYMPFYKECERELVLWISQFSSTKQGFTTLLCQNNFFQILYSYVQVPSCANFLAVIMYNMDFCRDNMAKKKSTSSSTKDIKDLPNLMKSVSMNTIAKNQGVESEAIIVGPKMFLQRSVKEGSKALTLSCIEVIKILFKVELTIYKPEGFRMIILMLKRKDSQITERVLELLQDLLRQKENLAEFLKVIKETRSFESVKRTLSNNILIRLVSLEEGFELVSKSMPSWLEEQYEHWTKQQQSHSYCLKLEALLDTSLNFTKKVHTGFKITTHKNLLQLLYLYKLPWVVYLNQDQYPLHIRENNNKFILYLDFEAVDNSNLIVKARRLEVSLGIGSMFVDQNFQQVPNRHVFIVSMSNQGSDAEFMTTNNGITVYYLRCEGIYEIKKIQIQIVLQTSNQNRDLPLHLIKNLSNSDKGIEFLCEKNFLKQSAQKLQRSQSLLEIRSTLWALGYFSSTNQGAQQIIEAGIFNEIITMSLECQTLSLRGTCRYVLNMICRSQIGRKYLESCQYKVNRKCLICLPSDQSKFFKISPPQLQREKIHYSTDEEYWRGYKLEPMNENETRIFNEISKLINGYLSSKSAITQLRELQKNNHKIWFSIPLFQNVMALMTYHRFRHDAKKKIIAFFEELIKSPEFNNEVQGKINYYIVDPHFPPQKRRQ